MKKNFIYALMSAIALIGAVGLSSCTDEEMAEVNPTYNPETGEVNVDFVFNVSTANEPFSTRMTAANTQADITDDNISFRGITDAYLATFSQAADNKSVSAANLVANKLHELGPVIGANKLNPNAEASGDVTKSRRVLQLSLESGTNSLLFWGKAVKDGTDLEQGKITMDIAATPANTKISMCKIVPETAYENTPGIYQAKFQQYQKLLAAVLTYIINSGVTGKEISFGEENKTITLNWKDYAVVSGEAGSYTLSQPTKDPSSTTEDLSLLGQRLAYTFVTLNTIHANELRAGCGLAINHMISDLMANINQIVSAIPLNLREVAAKEVAKDIKARVETFFSSDTSNEYVWKDADVVKGKATFVLDNEKNLVDDGSNISNFPADFNLPLGSVILELAITAQGDPVTSYSYKYNYQGTVDTYAMGGGNNAFDPKNYMYPAELCYFGNSSIRISNDTKVANDYPDGVANWESYNWNSNGWNNGHVTSSTRAVAMRDNINYGTALLESKVRYGAQTLEDNNKALQEKWMGANEPNNTIDVTQNDNHFVVTGILVGGQNPEVGWNYIAKSNTTGFGAMVYDKCNFGVPKATAPTGGNATSAVYTLLWDNWDAELLNSKQRDVYVAIELKNNSKNFFGENNLIRNGATFYLIGKLDPDKRPASVTDKTDDEYKADKSLGITWPGNYALPPYYHYDTESDANSAPEGKKEGQTIKERRVFMQDYMTKATFVIGATSLQKALVAVPDLRSGQISLGLSVDLQWQTGINFGDVILGQ